MTCMSKPHRAFASSMAAKHVNFLSILLHHAQQHHTLRCGDHQSVLSTQSVQANTHTSLQCHVSCVFDAVYKSRLQLAHLV